jgi:hypothetical protein
MAPRNTAAQAQTPKAEIYLVPEQVAAYCKKAAELTTKDSDGISPLMLMTHAELEQLAAKCDDFRERLTNPLHPQHTRMANWVRDKGAQVRILFTATNVVRARISQVDESIPAREKAVVDLSIATDVLTV